jgi:hypothetical protein
MSCKLTSPETLQLRRMDEAALSGTMKPKPSSLPSLSSEAGGAGEGDVRKDVPAPARSGGGKPRRAS